MAGDKGPKPVAEIILREWRRGRILSNILLLGSGILIGFYGAMFSNVSGGTSMRSSGSDAAPHSLLSRFRELDAAFIATGGPCPCANATDTKAEPCKTKAVRAVAVSSSSSRPEPLQPQVLREKAHLDTLNFIDGKQSFEELFDYLPQNIKDGVADRAVLLSTRGSQIKLGSAKPGEDIDFEQLRTCKEIETILMGTGRCYVAINTGLLHTSYHVQRYHETSAEGRPWTMIPRIEKEGSSPPISMNRQKHEKFLLALFQNLPDLEKKAGEFLAKAADADKRVMIMALNEGDLDMLVNFVCSARLAKIPLDNLIVVGSHQSVVDVATSLDLHSFSHPAFGTLPSAHSKHYGDAGFLAIMWLKIVSVWITVRLGYDVLFQDADLVWFKSPWEVFNDPGTDAYFMDDGSRSERFSPLYANSGFYYLRSNPRIIHFMQTVLFSYDMIVQYASHQTIVIQALQEHISRNGLRMKILEYTEFVGGQVYHHRKDLMAKIKKREYLPYTFHMCWTQTKADKVKNIKDAGIWYLSQTCNSSEASLQVHEAGSMNAPTCCIDPMTGESFSS